MIEAELSDLRPETRALHAQWLKEAAEFRAPPKHEPDDFLDRWLPAVAPLFDAGWNGDGWAPSKRVEMRYVMTHWTNMERLATWIKDETRARVAGGYHPFPLSNLRPSVSSAPIELPAD